MVPDLPGPAARGCASAPARGAARGLAGGGSPLSGRSRCDRALLGGRPPGLRTRNGRSDSVDVARPGPAGEHKPLCASTLPRVPGLPRAWTRSPSPGTRTIPSGRVRAGRRSQHDAAPWAGSGRALGIDREGVVDRGAACGSPDSDFWCSPCGGPQSIREVASNPGSRGFASVCGRVSIWAALRPDRVSVFRPFGGGPLRLLPDRWPGARPALGVSLVWPGFRPPASSSVIHLGRVATSPDAPLRRPWKGRGADRRCDADPRGRVRLVEQLGVPPAVLCIAVSLITPPLIAKHPALRLAHTVPGSSREGRLRGGKAAQ